MDISILTPILIAIGTALVGSLFQNKDDKIKQKRLKRATILNMAAQIYNEMSQKIDTLHYYLVNEAVYIAIRKAQDDIAQEANDTRGWQKYVDAVADWKTNRNRLISQVEVYYGKENADLLQNISDLIKIGESQIGATYYKTSHSQVKEEIEKEAARLAAKKSILSSLKTLDKDIRKLNRQMVQQLQSQKVGDLRL